MLTLLYLPSGVFLKPKEIFFDPHMRVGHLLLEYGMEDLMKYKKFLCKCYMSDKVYMEREIVVTSVDPKRGIALFAYEDFLPDIDEYFRPKDVHKLSEIFEIADVLDQINNLIEKSEMGIKVEFSRWIERSVPPRYRNALSRFAFSYHKLYREKFTDLDDMKRKLPFIAFRLYEMIQPDF